MTVSIQQLYARAKQSTPANADVIPRTTEVIAYLEAEQQALFASLAGVTRERFQQSVSITSTAGSSVRVFDLSGLSPVVERILQVVLSDGREAHQVDPLDVDAELSPRYIVRGQTLIEVSNDWLVGSSAVTATLLYVYGPTPLVTTGDYTQAVSVPDAWSDLLELPLEKYFAGMRPQADGEMDAINARLAKRMDDFVSYLTAFGGVRSNRFDIPIPTPQGKK